MNTLFVSIALLLSLQFIECTTTFEVTDCDGEPVIGANVIIETCEGEEISSVTDIDGKARFKVCSKDICKVRISYIGYATYSTSNISDECTVDEEGNATCELKICD